MVFNQITYLGPITLITEKVAGIILINVFQYNYDANHVYDYTRNRINNELSDSENVEFSTNFTQKFKKEGHKLTVDGSFSSNTDNNNALITDRTNTAAFIGLDETFNNQKQSRNLLQTDYVLPIGKNSQFEAGYKGDFQH